MNRRRFLRRASGLGAALTLGRGQLARSLATPATAPVQPSESPYGPLQAPDANGLELPVGFTSRVIANSLLPVAGTSYVWHAFPDGGACVPTSDGGWIYVSNSENPPPVDVSVPAALLALVGLGGVGAIRFTADGTVVDAYSVLSGSRSNCAGGLTPWGTWLSCEEWETPASPPLVAYEGGRVWECDPFGGAPVDRPALGRFKHEMAAVDPVGQRIYLSEDQPDGLLYRYTPPPGTWGSGAALAGGSMEAMAVDGGGAVTWLPVANAAAPTAPVRGSVPGATPFNGGEGLVHDSGRLYFTTKGDDRVWVHDIATETMTVLYDSAEFDAPVLSGVDNIITSAAHDIYVAEDGGNLEVCVITPQLGVSTVVRMTGPQHGFDSGTPIPTTSEVTGLALSPDGNRLYFNSERGNGIVPIGPGPGILYEVTGPFRGGSLAAAQQPTTTSSTTSTTAAPTTSTTAPPGTGGTTAPTGGPDLAPLAGGLAIVAGAVWALRSRTTEPNSD